MNILMVLRMSQSLSVITTIILKNKQTNRNTWLGPSGWLPLNCDTSILAFGKVSGRNGHSEGNLKYWDSMFNKYPQ